MNNNKNNLTPEYSIGVVTYISRFEEFFIPLIKQLVSVFPDKEIICIINGHHDTFFQINYLKRVTAFLSQYPNVRYITHEKHQPLAKCFNWLLLMTFAPRMLVLNDDVSLNLLFRQDFEKHLQENDLFFVINRSWCHFLVSKKLVKEIGWFDERLPGTGYEDGDYHIRMVEKGQPVTRVECRGLINYVALQNNPGWATISKKVSTGRSDKSAVINRDFFYSKYSTDGILKPGMETPLFYDYSCLDNEGNFGVSKFIYKDAKPPLGRILMLPVYAIYSYTRKIVRIIYRSVKKIFK
ncbi:MAG: hypothetical protein WCT40_01345 [Candidatus Magasanikbacteria bacterium]|jgi:hypothetical protein